MNKEEILNRIKTLREEEQILREDRHALEQKLADERLKEDRKRREEYVGKCFLFTCNNKNDIKAACLLSTDRCDPVAITIGKRKISVQRFDIFSEMSSTLMGNSEKFLDKATEISEEQFIDMFNRMVTEMRRSFRTRRTDNF